MSARKVVVFLGSCRENRMGARVATFIMNKLKETNNEVTLFDPIEMQFPVLQTPLHWYKDKSQAPGWMVEADQKIRDADAYVIVSGEYNCTIPPALTNMMDHFSPKSYAHKPSAIITYSMGMFAGVRAGVALLPFLLELGTVSIPAMISIPKVNSALDSDGKPSAEQDERLKRQATRLVEQLTWYADALKHQREAKGVPQ